MFDIEIEIGELPLPVNNKPAFYVITRIVFILFFSLILLTTSAAVAAKVTLRWDPSNPVPQGYRVFAREVDQAYNYSQPAWAGKKTTCTIYNLDKNTEHFFVVRAHDGNEESSDSNEVHWVPPGSGRDVTPPAWNGATTGIGLAVDSETGGSVTVEFDRARDGVDGRNLKFNVYFAPSKSWDNADWTGNSVIADAAVGAGSTFTHAVTTSGLTNNVRYTFGVRAEDQSGNEDANTRILKATPTVRQTASYNLMLSQIPSRSNAVYLDDAQIVGNIYVFVEPTTNIQRVEFLIDGVSRHTEYSAPYDLSGGETAAANPFDAKGLSNGYHTFSARITKTNGSRETISADVYVNSLNIPAIDKYLSNPV